MEEQAIYANEYIRARATSQPAAGVNGYVSSLLSALEGAAGRISSNTAAQSVETAWAEDYVNGLGPQQLMSTMGDSFSKFEVTTGGIESSGSSETSASAVKQAQAFVFLLAGAAFMALV